MEHLRYEQLNENTKFSLFFQILGGGGRMCYWVMDAPVLLLVVLAILSYYYLCESCTQCYFTSCLYHWEEACVDLKVYSLPLELWNVVLWHPLYCASYFYGRSSSSLSWYIHSSYCFLSATIPVHLCGSLACILSCSSSSSVTSTNRLTKGRGKAVLQRQQFKRYVAKGIIEWN